MGIHRLAEYVRGVDRKHTIISPPPDAQGQVTLAPGQEIVTEIVILPGDPLLLVLGELTKAPQRLQSTRRSRGAISGMRHDDQEPAQVIVFPDGSVHMTQGSRNHNLKRSIVIQDGDELSAIGIKPEEQFAMRNGDLLQIVANMRVPKNMEQLVLIGIVGANQKEYTLAEARQLLKNGTAIEFIEVGIPLQKKVGLLSEGPDIHLGTVRRAWQGLEEDIGLTWTETTEETAAQAIAQGVILQLTVPLIIPKGFVAVIQNGSHRPDEPEHGDSVVLAPQWREDHLQEIITEHYVHKGEKGIEIPRMIRVKFYRDSATSVGHSHAFKR